MPIVTTKKMLRKQEREERQREEVRQIEETKERLAKTYQIPRDIKFIKCFDLAWEHGHASGLGEVELLFNEYVTLIL